MINEYDRDSRSQQSDSYDNRQDRIGGADAKQGGSCGQDDNSDEEFPGYPHYPANEDIMNPSSEMKRVPVDVEKLTPSNKDARKAQPQTTSSTSEEIFQIPGKPEDDLKIVAGTEADVTPEDLNLLEATNEPYPSASVTGEDLDVPGAELDDNNEAIGEEDEENNYYSLGGDRHENLEEDPS